MTASTAFKSAEEARQHKAMHKGQQTKAAIVDAALGMATHVGVEGLSIGALAEAMHMSKSGVFAHFGSREELQISVVREYHNRFEDEVFKPALQQARGLPRLRALFDNWMQRSMGGCQYHVSHPGGRSHEDFPVNAYAAEGRRLARFFQMGHTPGKMSVEPAITNREFPFTLDLRRV